MGRVCEFYLTRDHVFFLHNLLSVDGVHCVVQFSKESLFHDYRISSNNDDRIAFSLGLSLLHRALRSVLVVRDSAKSPTLLIKLVKLPLPPFLTFEARDHRPAVVQDVPVSKPLSCAEVQDLHFVV